MSAISPAAPHDIPAVHAPAVPTPAWAWLLVATAGGVLYLLLQDNGAVLAQAASLVHEFAHDGRHAFGVPCH